MTMKENMRSLAEEIVRSHEGRTTRIAELRETVKSDLKDMGVELSKSEADRKSSVNTLLEDMRAAHVAMSRELKTQLTGNAINLKKDVAKTLDEFGRNRKVVLKELKTDLAKNNADRQREVNALLKDVDDMLNGFAKNRDATTKQIRADLAKSAAEREHDVDVMRKDVHVMIKGFEKKLNDMRSSVAGGRDEWQRLTATMRSKRGAAVAELQVTEGVPATVIQVVDASTKTADVPPELAAFCDRVFGYLANHPDGAKLVELEQEFGMARIQMSKIARLLMDKHKVEKRDNLYFAV